MYYLKSIITWILLFTSFSLAGQNGFVSGKIVDNNNIPLIGATIQDIASSLGTVSDFEGQYKLELPIGTYELEVSYVGYQTFSQIVNITNSNLILDFTIQSNALQMDEIVVSASFNEKSKLESSVSVTTLDAKEMEALAPVSAMEVIKNVPGINVNDADGEVGVEIQGRGLTTRYFSLQEDGLPSSISELASNEHFTRDMFLRNDLMTERIEAIRGGSASITSANSPGGIFNYITKTGQNRFEGTIRTKFGIQANGKEAYYKPEVFFSGPIGSSEWRYAIGGHYRYDGGNRLSKYPHSTGSQLKGNISRIFGDKLSIKISGKYLDDRVGFNRPTLVQNWNNIEPATGFDWEDNLVLPDVEFTPIDGFRVGENPGLYKKTSTRDQQKIIDKSILLDISYNLNDNWRVKSVTRRSNKSLIVNHVAEDGGFATLPIDGLLTRVFSNFNLFNSEYDAFTLGNFQFYDLETNEVLAEINTQPLSLNQAVQITNNNLPTGPQGNNGTEDVFWTLFDNDELDIKEFIQQITLTGQINNHFLTVGGYYSKAENFRTLNSGTLFMTVEPESRILGTRVEFMDYTNLAQFQQSLQKYVPYAGQTFQFSDPSGLHGYNTQVNEYNFLDEKLWAGYLNYEWTINSNINFEIGLRYEQINHEGRSGQTIVKKIEDDLGGFDGNINTIYDNTFNFFGGEYLDFDIDYNSLSYSTGINYKFNNHLAIYGRYSSSEKLLDAIYEQDLFINGEVPNFVPRTVDQAELGIKYSKRNLGIFAVAYRSLEKNIYEQLFVLWINNPNGQGFYLTPPLLNSVVHYGAEFEFMYYPTRWWSLRTIFNISGGTNQEYKVYTTGDLPSPEDDVLVDLSGSQVLGSTTNKYDFSPIDITNSFYFNKKRGSLLINYRRFAKRYANTQQAFTLPSFGIWKLGVSYHINKNISAAFNINNVLNEVGVLRFNGYNEVAGYPENVTPEFIVENPDTWFKVQRSLPRAFYFTLTYNL